MRNPGIRDWFSDRRGSAASAARRVLRATIIALARMSNRHLLPRFRRDQSGNYAIITALLMPALVGFVGLGTEVGLWLYKHQTMQGAADSGATSAATAYSKGNTSGLAAQADAVTASYGFVAGSNGVTVTVNRPPQSGNYTATQAAVEVIVQQPQARLFSALFSPDPVAISARAVAVGKSGIGCVLSLDANAGGATTIQGNASVVLNGCSLFDNSGNATALTVGGSANLSALSVGVVGDISGTTKITTTQGISTGIAPVADPYANVSFPSFSGCDHNNYDAKTTVTIDPGVYCGGLSVGAGANVTLNPGIYYIDQGSLTVNGGATMTGTGVTLVFTSSSGTNWPTATINGGATINLTPPSSGPTAGIVFFGDRNMPVGRSFKFLGGLSQALGGAIYLPKGEVTFSGGAGTGASCTQLIANTITFSGNTNFALNCSGYGTNAIASAAAILVE